MNEVKTEVAIAGRRTGGSSDAPCWLLTYAWLPAGSRRGSVCRVQGYVVPLDRRSAVLYDTANRDYNADGGREGEGVAGGGWGPHGAHRVWCLEQKDKTGRAKSTREVGDFSRKGVLGIIAASAEFRLGPCFGAIQELAALDYRFYGPELRPKLSRLDSRLQAGLDLLFGAVCSQIYQFKMCHLITDHMNSFHPIIFASY